MIGGSYSEIRFYTTEFTDMEGGLVSAYLRIFLS